MGVLYAKVGGTFVPIAQSGPQGPPGPDEVMVQPDDPIVANPLCDVWYDTDEPMPPVGALPVGGVAGQVLTKTAAGDYAAGWAYGPPLAFATQAARDSAWPAATAGNGAQSFTTDKSRLWISNGTIWKLTGGSLPRVRAQKATVQSVSALTPLTFDGADLYDTDAMHDPAVNNTRITIPAGLGGVWLLDYHCYGVPLAALSECYILVNGGGARVAWAKQSTGAANEDISLSASAAVVLNAGDYVELNGYSQPARTYSNVSFPAYFGATYLGAS